MLSTKDLEAAIDIFVTEFGTIKQSYDCGILFSLYYNIQGKMIMPKCLGEHVIQYLSMYDKLVSMQVEQGIETENQRPSFLNICAYGLMGRPTILLKHL